jgi:hypothetical protein
MPMITLAYTDKHFERPPLIRVEFDVTLHNPGAVPRWFLLPTHFAEDMHRQYQISELSMWTLANDAHKTVFITRLRGPHGCFVIYLAAGVEITLRGLPIRWRGTLPEHFTLQAHTADEVLLDAESLITWFEDAPLNSQDADVDARTLADDSQVQYAKTTPDLSEKTVHLANTEELLLEVMLA